VGPNSIFLAPAAHAYKSSYTLFFYSRKPHLLESVFCGSRWVSKTPVIPGSYKRCTPWLELETSCADLKPFAITLRPLGTHIHTSKTIFIKLINIDYDIKKLHLLAKYTYYIYIYTHTCPHSAMIFFFYYCIGCQTQVIWVRLDSRPMTLGSDMHNCETQVAWIWPNC